ncbi:MAG TPA: hypothetical protein VLL52_09810 [Anaerolineae bacterium]|nr:hypothetical protein [Anaerolineae bacterium]
MGADIVLSEESYRQASAVTPMNGRLVEGVVIKGEETAVRVYCL